MQRLSERLSAVQGCTGTLSLISLNLTIPISRRALLY